MSLSRVVGKDFDFLMCRFKKFLGSSLKLKLLRRDFQDNGLRELLALLVHNKDFGFLKIFFLRGGSRQFLSRK